MHLFLAHFLLIYFKLKQIVFIQVMCTFLFVVCGPLVSHLNPSFYIFWFMCGRFTCDIRQKLTNSYLSNACNSNQTFGKPHKVTSGSVSIHIVIVMRLKHEYFFCSSPIILRHAINTFPPLKHSYRVCSNLVMYDMHVAIMPTSTGV